MHDSSCSKEAPFWAEFASSDTGSRPGPLDDTPWQSKDLSEQNMLCYSNASAEYAMSPYGAGIDLTSFLMRTYDASMEANIILTDTDFMMGSCHSESQNAWSYGDQDSSQSNTGTTSSDSSSQIEASKSQIGPALLDTADDTDLHFSNHASSSYHIKRSSNETRSRRCAIWRRRSRRREEDGNRIQRSDSNKTSPITEVNTSATRYESGLGLYNPFLSVPDGAEYFASEMAAQQQVFADPFDPSTVDTLMAKIAERLDQNKRSLHPLTSNIETNWNDDISAAAHAYDPSHHPRFAKSCASMPDLELQSIQLRTKPAATTPSQPSTPPQHRRHSAASEDVNGGSAAGISVVKLHQLDETKEEKPKKRGALRVKRPDGKDVLRQEKQVSLSDRKKCDGNNMNLKLSRVGGDDRERDPIQRVIKAKGSDGVDRGFSPHGTASSNEDVRYKCPHPTCDKLYSTSGHARRHSRIHTSTCLFQCPIEDCLATFTRRDNCTQHQKSVHAVGRSNVILPGG
ncbi:hypothetical protein CBS101457_004940 [Exobasidium rhododendri]|nr:hypothetical protein CBS101457_004940 [Exobasidium rhododendri]